MRLGCAAPPYSGFVALSGPGAQTLADLAVRWPPERFLVTGIDAVQTPALVIDQDAVDMNIAAMRQMIGERWRPHLKSAKLGWAMRRLVAAGVTRCKCATTLELEAALQAGFEDVLVAFALRGPAVQRVAELSAATAQRVSVLVEHSSCIEHWRGTDVGVFIDLDPGSDRSGVPCDNIAAVRALAREVAGAGLTMRGLHSYEGGAPGDTDADRLRWCGRGFDAICRCCEALAADGLAIEELVTSGSRTWPFALAHQGLRAAAREHTVSPGIVIYNDARSLLVVPSRETLCPAAAVLTRVMSVGRGRLTLDAGHKAIVAPKGPTGVVLGYPHLHLQTPSEEHGPVASPDVSDLTYGDMLVVVPNYINPTVNLHDYAVIVRGGTIAGVERVTARGHSRPL